MPESNIKQAWVLPSVTPLANPVGTAPGWWAERDGKVIVAMPGVPHEMKRMWEHEVLPRLRDRAGEALFTRTLRVAGLGESTVEQRLDQLTHRSNPTIATYAKPDAVDVRISAKAATREEAERLVWPRWRSRLARCWASMSSASIRRRRHSVALKMLIEQGLTLATMESCSGGLLASTITDVPGSSASFHGRTGGLRHRAMKVAVGRAGR